MHHTSIIVVFLKIGTFGAKLVIRKQLRVSDVNSNNNCFLISKNQIQNEFLKETKKCLLDKHAKNVPRPCGLNVWVLDPYLKMFNWQLKMWKTRRNTIYKSTHEWNNVQIRNDLEKKDLV